MELLSAGMRKALEGAYLRAKGVSQTLIFRGVGAEMSVRNTSEVIRMAVGQMSVEIRGSVWPGEIHLGGDTCK